MFVELLLNARLRASHALGNRGLLQKRWDPHLLPWVEEEIVTLVEETGRIFALGTKPQS